MTDTSTAILVGPLAAFATALVAAAVAAAIRPSLVAGVAALQKLTGIKVQQVAVDELDAKIEDAVGSLSLSVGGKLATETITIGHPYVTDIANAIVAESPTLLANAGVTPANVASIVHGEIGKWQAPMTRVMPQPPAADPAKA